MTRRLFPIGLCLVLAACVWETREEPAVVAAPPPPVGAPTETPPAPPRVAVDEHEPAVRADNIAALGDAREPFARYLVGMHQRIHPIFTDQYLASLEASPSAPGHALDKAAYTELELVLHKTTGNIALMSVRKSSGSPEFDVAALESVDHAAPFGPAPDVIASPDGKVYVHWQFHRDPVVGCSPINVRPFKLKRAPAKPGP